MSEETPPAAHAARTLIDQLARDGGPASPAGRLLMQHTDATAQRMGEELGPNLTETTARRWLTDFESVAPTRFLPGAPNLPHKPVNQMSAEERLSLANWQADHRKECTQGPVTKLRLPDHLRTASAETKLAWANAQLVRKK